MLRILHITESMASGVLQVLAQLAQAQVEAGARVHITHSVRSDTPADEVLERIFPAPISREIVPLVTAPSIFADLRGMLALAASISRYQPDVVHLHSSKAGALGRIVCRIMGVSPVFYSPHGFSFLRLDIPAIKRKAFFQIERLMAGFGGRIVACSKSEADLAGQLTRPQRVTLVENAIDLQAVPAREARTDESIRVISSGRLCYQKAPWRFYELAHQLRDECAEFTWIGGGDKGFNPYASAKGCDRAHTTGWLDRRALLQLVAGADVYVLLSLWEGMPLGLIEAQTAGLPAVVSDVIGSRDVVKHGVTGFVCANDAEAVQRTQELIADPALRAYMGRAAREMALSRFDARRMHSSLWNLYNACDCGVTPCVCGHRQMRWN
jgi:glycosyltransferase involved in cell wall biosynthesis